MLYKSGTGIWRPRRRAVPLRGAVAGGDFAWWDIPGQTCVAAYQPKGAASLAASYTNLANPGTYDAAPGTAPTWAAGTGWTFDGTQYLNTGIVPKGGWAGAGRVSGASAMVTNALFGVMGAGTMNKFLIFPRYNVLGRALWRSGKASESTPFTDGVAVVTATNGYLNGVSVSTLTGALGVENTLELIVGGNNYQGDKGGTPCGTIGAVAFYSDTLSADDVAVLTTRMQSL